MAKRAKARELIELKKTTNSAAFRRAHGSYPAWRVLISAYSDHLLATGSAVADVTRIIHAVGHSIEPVPSAATCFTAPGAGRG